MGLMVSVYGASINGTEGEQAFKQYDLSCPNVSRGGILNFWKYRCLVRIGDRNIQSCYKGCKEAAKHPELREKMNKVLEAIKAKSSTPEFIAEKKTESRAYNRSRYIRVRDVIPLNKITKEQRSRIINMYLSASTIKETCDRLGCGRTVVSLYRKMYREGLMSSDGEIAKN